jgi:hypothetical protein
LKRQTKTVIDVGFDRLGTALASGVAMVLVALSPTGATSLMLGLAVVLSLAAVVVVRAIHRGYVATLAEGLRVDDRESGFMASRPTLTTLRGSGGGIDRRALLQRIESVSPLDSAAAQAARLIPHLATPAIAFDALRALEPIASGVVGQLVDALLDPATDATARKRIPGLLARSNSPRAVDGLVLALEDPAAEVRERSALALHAMRRRDAALAAPPGPVRAALTREIAPGATRLEQALALASLLLPRAPLAPALRALDANDERLRGTALEYLHEVLPDDLRGELWPHIVGRRTAPRKPLLSALTR